MQTDTKGRSVQRKLCAILPERERVRHCDRQVFREREVSTVAALHCWGDSERCDSGWWFMDRQRKKCILQYCIVYIVGLVNGQRRVLLLFKR